MRARRGGRLGLREEEAEVGCDDDLRVCRCGVIKWVKQARAHDLLSERRIDTLVRAPALKVVLSAMQGEGWGNFWLPCGFPD